MQSPENNPLMKSGKRSTDRVFGPYTPSTSAAGKPLRACSQMTAFLVSGIVAAYPQLARLNVMNLGSPASVILSAVIFNAVIIILLIPLALRGLSYVPTTTAAMRRNLLVYGLGGLILPFIGIKAVNLVITGLGLV